MSSDNDRCFQCQEIGHMAHYCPHIWCYDCDNYGHVAMDCPDKIPSSGTLTCLRTDTNDRHERSSSRHHSHTRCSHHDYKDRSRFSCSQSHPHNHRYRSNSHQDHCRSHSRSFHRPSHHSFSHQRSSSSYYYHCDTPHHRPSSHRKFPKMTADLNINPGSNTTDQPEDPHPPHRHHLGNIRIRDTSKSPLMTHHQSTTAQMTMTVTQRMI